MPDNDIVLAKVAMIQKCLDRIRDVTGLDPESLEDINKIVDLILIDLPIFPMRNESRWWRCPKIDYGLYISRSELSTSTGVVPLSLHERATQVESFPSFASSVRTRLRSSIDRATTSIQ